jgi:hypothetical protein
MQNITREALRFAPAPLATSVHAADIASRAGYALSARKNPQRERAANGRRRRRMPRGDGPDSLFL